MPLRCRERWTHGAKLVAPKKRADARDAADRTPFFKKRLSSRARLTPDV